MTIPGDLSNETECQKLIDTAVTELGGIDLLAIIAGKQTAVEDIQDITTAQFDKPFKTSIYGMFWLTKFAVQHMSPG